MLKEEDSLKKRYLAKLSANLIGLAIGVVTQAIIPRGLGPTAYGNFSFLSNFFTQIVGFLDMGTSIGFYTKLSQRQGDFGLVSFYLSFACLASFLVFVFVGYAQVSGVYATLWPDQKLFYIYLAAIWGILAWFVQIVNKMADAYGVTVSTEIARIIQKVLALAIIVTLFFTSQLNLTNFFLYHYFILIFLALAFIWVMECKGYSLKRSWKLPLNKIKAYAREFYSYSHPLFVYALVGLIVGILDRWMLQKFSGSVEQGFYGLSYQIGAVCFLFTSAMTPLITREFAIAFGEKDLREMARLFRRYLPMFYAIAAFLGCFVAGNADKVTYLFGGSKFANASLAVSIMALYPIYQTYGQLSGSVFFATGQTRLYRNIGVTFMILGLPTTYFLIAPENMMGLNAGSTGLAIKTIVLAFVAINVQLFFNTRFLRLSFLRFLWHQVYSLGCLWMCVHLSAIITDKMLGEDSTLSFFVSGIVYVLIVCLAVYIVPSIFGVTREEIRFRIIKRILPI